MPMFASSLSSSCLWGMQPCCSVTQQQQQQSQHEQQEAAQTSRVQCDVARGAAMDGGDNQVYVVCCWDDATPATACTGRCVDVQYAFGVAQANHVHKSSSSNDNKSNTPATCIGARSVQTEAQQTHVRRRRLESARAASQLGGARVCALRGADSVQHMLPPLPARRRTRRRCRAAALAAVYDLLFGTLALSPLQQQQQQQYRLRTCMLP